MDPRVEHSRRAICHAALDEFAATGYAGFRMEAVAVRAGVGRSTLYRHWSDKSALIADALESLNVQPDPRREGATTVRNRVAVLLRHLADALADSPVSACIPALVHAADTEPAVRSFFHEYSARRRQRLSDAIEAGVVSGEFPERVDPDAAATALSGALFYRRLATSEPADDDFLGRLLETVLGR